MKVAKFLLVFILGLFILYVLEGACFRLVEKYADNRLTIAWGYSGTGTFNSILKHLPIDHFKKRPEDEPIDADQSSLEKAMVEGEYADAVMSFARPMRDRYEEYVKSKLEPLSKFEIRDYGEVRGLVLPGLKKPASLEDVNKKDARRVGDDLEYSEGMLLRVLASTKPEDYENEFAQLESTFGFLLENGIACLVLPVSSGEEILDKITYLQAEHKLLTQNIFAWGDQKAAGYLLEACRESPERFKGVFVGDPIGAPRPPNVTGLPWLTVQISQQTLSKEDGDLNNVLSWVRAGRMINSVYPSRLGGLLHVEDSPKSGQMPSFFVACLLQCSRYIERVGGKWPTPQPLSAEDSVEGITVASDSPSMEEEKPFDLERIENTIQKLSKEEEETVKLVDATFDCEIVKGYRQLHSNNPNLKQVSNRDLVLMLGAEFEKMGVEVLDQVKARDPLFYRFYLSLRALEDSPLH